jgi:superfamily II DNA helicase RecQ
MLIPRVIDVIRRCQEMGIQYAVYQSGLADQLTFGTPLVFASMEHADSSEFRTYLYRMELAQQLDRIVLDKAHLVLTAASYRANLEAALQLRHLQCQLIYLTATLPPIMISAFEQRLGLRNPEVIRSITFRKDIQLRVDQQPNHSRASFENWCCSEIVKRALPRDDQSRFIIYCRYKGECESLAKLLKCEFYHSSTGSDEEKGSIFERWLDGKYVMICCTQAFGAGLDYSRVDGVFFVGAWNDPLEFLQAMGRAGRSGQDAFCITLLDRRWKSSLSARIEPLIGPEELVVEHSLLGKECRAKALSEYVDGVAWYCEKVANRCDVCE